MVQHQLPRPRVWTVFVAWILIVAATLAVQIGVIAFAPAAFVQSTAGIILLFAIAPIVSVAGTVLAARMSKAPTLARLSVLPSSARPITLITAVVGMLVLSMALSFVLRLANASSPVIEALASATRGASPVETGLLTAIGGVFAPVAEELLFRGYVQTRLVARWGAVPGILISSVLFGITHMDLVQGGIAIVLGVYMGWVAHRSRSVRPAILIHATNNLAAFAMAAVGVDIDVALTSSVPAILATGVVAVAAFTVCVAAVRSGLRAARGLAA